ncbi:transposase, partial [Aerococcus urinaeequi]|uniref:transposase n=1 Tax=Aerococcus urinaeequi TaxID=51665 RepID=UPI003EDA84EB
MTTILSDYNKSNLIELLNTNHQIIVVHGDDIDDYYTDTCYDIIFIDYYNDDDLIYDGQEIWRSDSIYLVKSYQDEIENRIEKGQELIFVNKENDISFSDSILTYYYLFNYTSEAFHVSSPTVTRILLKAGEGLSPKGNYLPSNLGIDEFKSTNRVANAMSAVLVDTHNRRLIDIIVDRKQASLIDYFASFTWAARSSVKTVSIDLYTPYLEVIRTSFPNAKIVIDRFHIVKLLNETINSVRIKAMNIVKNSRPSDY